jgi:hyperosmotically inducible periplasmic protein
MYRLIMVGILGMGCMSLMGCESTTGITAGQTMDDATVTASVQGKLTRDKASNFTRIDVDTQRGVVTLNGVVQNVQDKSRAEILARQVDGVAKVINNLQVESLSSSSNP